MASCRFRQPQKGRPMRVLERYCLLSLLLLVLSVAGVAASLLGFLSPADHWRALTSPETRFALKFTLFTSATATALALLLALPGAYLMARKDFPGKQALDAFLDLPLVMPPLVAGLGLLLLLGESPVGRGLSALGLHLLFSPAGVVLAQTFVASFIVLRGAKAAFEAVDPKYESAGLTLGLSPWQVFWRITLPMAGQGIVSTAVMAWARAMGEFGATLMVAGATRMLTETMPIAVYLNISSGEPGIAIACALLLMAMGFTLLAALRWVTGWARWSSPGRGKMNRPAAGCWASTGKDRQLAQPAAGNESPKGGCNVAN